MTSDLQELLDELIDEYVSVACPCRFPRFRAVASRTTRGAGGGSFTSEERRALIQAFDHLAPIVEKRPMEDLDAVGDGMWIARCGKCASVLRRSYEEFSPGGTIDSLRVVRAPGIIDVGAPVRGSVYRCRPLEAPGPGMAGLAEAARMFPLISEGEWLAWMRERS